MSKPDCSSRLVGDIREIWDVVEGNRESYDFKVGDAARGQLESIIGLSKCNEVFKNNCPSCVNKELRKALCPCLKTGPKDRRLRISRWIVRDWGGIRRGEDSVVDGWVDCLDDFSAKRLNQFAKEMGFERIASWSKILAFAAPNHYAIYDARVAASLNCCLTAIQARNRFYQPRSRNKTIEKAHRYPSSSSCSYFDYLKFLKAVAETGRCSSILEAEMALFACAEKLVKKGSLDGGSCRTCSKN